MPLYLNFATIFSGAEEVKHHFFIYWSRLANDSSKSLFWWALNAKIPKSIIWSKITPFISRWVEGCAVA